MNTVVGLITSLIDIYIYVIIIYVVITWLVAFEILNTRNQFVRTVGDFLYRVTEPAIKPIRRVVPSLGGVDLSPMILIGLLVLVRGLMHEYLV